MTSTLDFKGVTSRGEALRRLAGWYVALVETQIKAIASDLGDQGASEEDVRAALEAAAESWAASGVELINEVDRVFTRVCDRA